MKVIVDAMGGDNAPREIVRGALLGAKEFNTDVILVGRGEEILQVLKDEGHADIPRGIEISHASQVIGMEEHASAAIREKPDSSIMVGLRLLASGAGQAFVSAGSTGALLSGATLTVKRVRGIRRAAMSPFLPTVNGVALLVDAGANAECSEEYLLQFAYMGSYYCKKVMKIDKPRVALLNIGAEPTKGTETHQRAYALLKAAGESGRIHFTGNIEGRDVIFGEADVVVADGFSGNVLLKTTEGVGKFFNTKLKEMFSHSAKTKMGYLLVKEQLNALRKIMDYTEYGGAPMLGLNAPVIKTHGSADANAVRHTIRQARDFAQSGLIEDITANIAYMKVNLPEGGGGEA